MINLHFSYKASTVATSTDIEFSILLPEVFVSALSFPQGSPPEARDQGYLQLGYAATEASVGVANAAHESWTGSLCG